MTGCDACGPGHVGRCIYCGWINGKPFPKFGSRVYGEGQTGRVSEVFPGLAQPTITVRWADGSFGSYDLDDLHPVMPIVYAGIDRTEWRLR